MSRQKIQHRLNFWQNNVVFIYNLFLTISELLCKIPLYNYNMDEILIHLNTATLVELGRRMEREGFQGTLAEYTVMLLLKRAFTAR